MTLCKIKGCISMATRKGGVCAGHYTRKRAHGDYRENIPIRHFVPRGELTNQERKVACLISTGKCNKQVADEMGISIKTLCHHRMSVYQKLRVHTACEVSHYCLHKKWIINLYESEPE